ncbi:MAG: guanylate kinase [Eubacteriales bacterium]|nr:guanylate kinase [Eubacteriales bacterium]
MKNKGILIVLSGFSGAGKGTLMRRLLELYPEEYALSISATTRQPRKGEVEGREYFFKSREAFEEMIREDAFVEYACYVENYYGTPKAYVEEQLAAGKNVLLEIELQGARKVRAKRPDTLLLFVTPPDAATLKERLIGRQTESMEVIEARLARAAKEAEGMEEYDYLVVNDDLDTCVEEMHRIISSERFRTNRNTQLIETIQNDVKQFSKGE